MAVTFKYIQINAPGADLLNGTVTFAPDSDPMDITSEGLTDCVLDTPVTLSAGTWQWRLHVGSAIIAQGSFVLSDGETIVSLGDDYTAYDDSYSSLPDVGGGGGSITLTGDVTGSGSGTVATTIANDAVTNLMIADNAVDTAQIADNAVTNSKIVNSAGIPYSKLNLTGTIVDADVASGAAIAYSKLALSNSIVAGDIASGAVTTVKILDANVTTAKIADANVSEAKLLFADNATGDVSTSKHGFAPKGDGSVVKFLNANGAYSSPIYRESGWANLASVAPMTTVYGWFYNTAFVTSEYSRQPCFGSRNVVITAFGFTLYSGQSSGGSMTVTLRKTVPQSGVAYASWTGTDMSTITVNASGNNGPYSTIGVSLAYNAGDLYDFKLTNNSIGASGQFINFWYEWSYA